MVIIGYIYTMKQIDYIGSEGDCIVIEQPTDIYPLLDWCHSRMMEKQEDSRGSINNEKWQKAIDYLGVAMDHAEEHGFGNMESVDNIKFG